MRLQTVAIKASRGQYSLPQASIRRKRKSSGISQYSGQHTLLAVQIIKCIYSGLLLYDMNKSMQSQEEIWPVSSIPAACYGLLRDFFLAQVLQFLCVHLLVTIVLDMALLGPLTIAAISHYSGHLECRGRRVESAANKSKYERIMRNGQTSKIREWGTKQWKLHPCLKLESANMCMLMTCHWKHSALNPIGVLSHVH